MSSSTTRCATIMTSARPRSFQTATSSALNPTLRDRSPARAANTHGDAAGHPNCRSTRQKRVRRGTNDRPARLLHGHLRGAAWLLSSAAMSGADDLQLAFGASNLAAELALAHFEAGVSVTLKADGTPVTEADRAGERSLREALSQARPDDAFLRFWARNLASSVGPNGSGSSTRLTTPGSSVGVIRTGGFRLLWRSKGSRRSRLSPLRRCDAVVGDPGWRFLRVVLAAPGERDAAPHGQQDVDAR